MGVRVHFGGWVQDRVPCECHISLSLLIDSACPFRRFSFSDEQGGRLLPIDAQTFVHVLCIIFSTEISECEARPGKAAQPTGYLKNAASAVSKAKSTVRCVCQCVFRTPVA